MIGAVIVQKKIIFVLEFLLLHFDIPLQHNFLITGVVWWL